MRSRFSLPAALVSVGCAFGWPAASDRFHAVAAPPAPAPAPGDPCAAAPESVGDQPAARVAEKPNIVMIMLDDVGPFDLSCYHRGLGCYQTPNIDRIARDGLMLSDYYAQPSCTAGRAAFITGQYPIRTGLTSVGQPGALIGLRKEDPTLAELLKPMGYATALFGKSHTGDRNEFLPTVHGFDEFFGILYHLNMMEMPEQPEFSKDPNFPGRPRNVVACKASEKDDATVDSRWGRVGKQVIEDKGMLGAKRMESFDEEVFDLAKDWLGRTAKAGAPFFLWFCPTRMHQQIHVGPPWRGKSGHGDYADALMQVDAIIGKLLDELDRLKLSDDTIVLFTSDNGVNLAHWPMAGTAGFRGEKGTTWDGGLRVPMLVRWPGKTPAGQWTGEFVTSEDWLPTLLAAAGEAGIVEKLREGREVGDRTCKVHLDGYDQLDVLTGKGKSKRREFFYFAETQLSAIRVDQWKVHLATKDDWLEEPKKIPGGIVIDIKLDPFERTPGSKGHFLWMKEKSWIMPILTPPITRFARSMQDFPPRQEGTGIGAATLLNQLKDSNPSDR